MAISLISPSSTSVIGNSDAFSFLIDDTYTTLTILVETAGGNELAYDTGAGGAQAGYTVVVTSALGVSNFTVSRDAGWDESPFTVTVTEDESGVTVVTAFSYYLTGTQTFTEGTAPYFGDQIGNLQITEGEAARRADVGWIDFDAGTFNITDLGAGKVRVTGIGGAGSGSPAQGLGAWVYESGGGSPAAGNFTTNLPLMTNTTTIKLADMASGGNDFTDVFQDTLTIGDYIIIRDAATGVNRAALRITNVLDAVGHTEFTTVPENANGAIIAGESYAVNVLKANVVAGSSVIHAMGNWQWTGIASGVPAPTAGEFVTDTATADAVTSIELAYTDGDATLANVKGLIDEIATSGVGYLYVVRSDRAALGVGGVYKITNVVDNTTYATLTVTALTTPGGTYGTGVDFDFFVLPAGSGTAAGIEMARIAGSTYSTVQEMQDIFHSSGLSSGGVIADAGSGQITVTAGTGFIRATDNPLDTLLYFDFPNLTATTITDQTVRYVGVEYNGGSPQVVVRTTDVWDNNTAFRLGTVSRDGTTIHISQAAHQVGDHAGIMIERGREVAPLARDNRTGGLALGEDGANRYVTVTAGALWEGLSRYTIPAFDTDPLGAADTMTRIYRDGVGGWTYETAQTQWNNTQYDNGTGTLATMTNGRYTAHYFYVAVDGELYMQYGQAEYTSLALAEEDTVPTFPFWFKDHAKLVGRIIFQKSASAASSIESAFDSSFSGEAVSDHGALAGLGDDDHTQYSLVDGTRAFTGPIEVDSATASILVGEHSSAPGTPAAGKVAVYAKADGLLYSKDDAGAETLVSGGAAGNAQEVTVWTPISTAEVTSVAGGTPTSDEVSFDTNVPGSVTEIKIHEDLKLDAIITGNANEVPSIAVGDEIYVGNAIWDVTATVSAVAGPTASVYTYTVTGAAGAGTILAATTGRLSVGKKVGGVDINALTSATVASGDLVLIEDISDSNNRKKVTAGDIAALGGGGGGSGTKTLALNQSVAVDATEVVIGGGYIDGSTGGTYSWNLTGIYNDGGGTGNQDLEIRLYDMGPDGTPTAGTLRSTLEIISLDTLDYVSQALTAAASPGTGTNEIQNAARMYEVRAYIDAAGSLDSGTVLAVEFVES